VKIEWVEEVPATVRKKRGNEYDGVIAELKKNPGKPALVATGPRGSVPKGIMALRSRGAIVTRRTFDGKVHVYASWPKSVRKK